MSMPAPKDSLTDFYLAAVCFYVSLTEGSEKAFDVPGFAEWWDRAQDLKAYKATERDLG